MDAKRKHLHFLKHIHVCVVYTKTYPSNYGGAVFSLGKAKSPLWPFCSRAFVFMTKVSKLQSAFTQGTIALLVIVKKRWASLTDLQTPIIICNCGKVKRKTWLFTGIYGSLYLMCHTSQGSIALNSLLIGKSWLCSDESTSLSTRPGHEKKRVQ